MPSRNGRGCPVANCTFHNKAKTSNFRFPKNPDICKKWVDFTNNPKTIALFTERGCAYVNKNTTMCSWHFRRNQLKNPDCPSRGLKAGEVPTLSHPDEIYSEHIRKKDEDYKPDNSEINCVEESKIGTSDGIIIEYPENTIEYQENHTNGSQTNQDEYQLIETENSLEYDDIFQEGFLLINSTQVFSQSGLTNQNIISINNETASPKIMIIPNHINGLQKSNFTKTEIKFNEATESENTYSTMTLNETVGVDRNFISLPHLQNGTDSYKTITNIHEEHIYTKPGNKKYLIKKVDGSKTENKVLSSISDIINENNKADSENLEDDESVSEKADISEKNLDTNVSKTDRSIENFLIINALSRDPNCDYNSIKKQCKVIKMDEDGNYSDLIGERHKNKKYLSKITRLKFENEYLKKRVAFLQKKIKNQVWELKILKSEVMFGSGNSRYSRHPYVI